MSITRLNQITKNQLNQEIELTLLLANIKIRTDKNQKLFADLLLQDETMKTDIRMWDYAAQEAVMQGLQLPAIVDCVILVGEYRDQLQLTAKKCIPTANVEIRFDELVQSSQWDPVNMKTWLRDYYEFIKAPHIRELIHRMVFSEPYYEKFCIYPAARKVHHNYMYGIMQHTLEVLKYVKMVASTKRLSQRQLDRLLAMAFLHDWAKIMEYEPLPSDEMTREGRLLGHIFIGAHHTQNTIEQINGFDTEDALIIMNGILGHHGSHEWGSPVLPKTIEAQILHQADKLSSDIESILSFVEEQKNHNDMFTDKLWNMGTDYYKGGQP